MPHIQQSAVRNSLLKAMVPDDFGRLAPDLHRVAMPTQQVLIEAHRPVETFHFLESGISSIVAQDATNQVEVGMIGREGLTSAIPLLLGSDRTPHAQLMQVSGEGFRIGAAALCAAVEASPTLRRLLLRYVQTEVVQARQTAYCNAAFNTEPRLARWLLMCHDRIDGDELQLKHEFLAVMLGVQRSGVTLALQALEGMGCIRGRRGRITITDRPGLVAVAGASYGTAEAEYARLIEGA